MSSRHELTDAGILSAAQALGVETAIVRAVAEVEAQGSGFLADGRPKILFEGHQFSKRTQGRFDQSHPTISYRAWTRKHYLGGAREHERLAIAKSLDKTPALESTSWGAFQIMGFNHRACGFPDVERFVEAMHESADEHLAAFINFVKSEGLGAPLKSKAWAEFARRYNGPGYAVNRYDTKLADAYARHAAA